MSWGVDGPVAIPDGTTWVGSVDGRTWETSGSDLEWSGFNYEFHLYYDEYPWTVAAWTEVTTLGIESFQIRRGVRSWWEGMAAGSATITLVNDAGVASIASFMGLNTKLRLTVDTPSGEHDLFVGWIFDRVEQFDAETSSLHLVLQDHIGYTGEAAYPALAQGTCTTGYMLSWLLQSYGNAIVSADVAGITVADGLDQNGTVATVGNLLDLLNTYLRGELGIMWVDGSGVFQFRERDWWYPQPDPVATIGSLDRGGITRNDPALGDTGYLVPWSQLKWRRALSVNFITWTGPFAGGTTSDGNSATQSGYRYKTDAVLLVTSADASNNLNFLVGVIGDEEIDDDLGEVVIAADHSIAAMEYCARADVTDFVEVASETQLQFGRNWKPAWVMGVSHRFDPYSGWWCTLDVDPNFALFNFAVPIGD